MIRRTVVPYTLAMFLAAPFLAAADPQAPAEKTVLTAQDLPTEA